MNCAINDVLECIEVEQTNSAEVRAQEVNKKHVAEHFSAACGNYDHYAQVQKQIAEVNLELLSHVIAGRSKFSVDLGCGTGLHTSLLAKMSDNCLAIDISHGMLKVAQINNTDMTTATNNAILYCSGAPRLVLRLLKLLGCYQLAVLRNWLLCLILHCMNFEMHGRTLA